MNLIDSHCHIDFEQFDDDRDAVLTAAAEVGVGRLINPGTDMASSRRASALARAHDGIFAAVGFEIDLLEYHDTAGQFVARDWHADDGMVWRSSRFDRKSRPGIERYTSLILDARKPR